MPQLKTQATPDTTPSNISRSTIFQFLDVLHPRSMYKYFAGESGLASTIHLSITLPYLNEKDLKRFMLIYCHMTEGERNKKTERETEITRERETKCV